MTALVDFVCRSFPNAKKLFNFNVVVPYIQGYMLYSLITTRVSRLAYKDMTLDISSCKILSEY